LKENVVNSIIAARKNYLANKSKGELLVLIKEYSKLGLYKEISRYIREFFKGGGDISELMEISDNFSEEIKKFFDELKAKIQTDEDFDADSLLEMGGLLWEIGSPEEAKDNYIKAFENYNILGRIDSAEEVLNTIRERYPEDPEVSEFKIRDIRGELLPRLDKLGTLMPQDEVDLRYALGKSMHEADLLSDAEENYRRILTLKDDHKARRYLVALLRDKNALEEALNYARKLEESERVDEYYALAELFKEQGMNEKANALISEIYEIDPGYKDVKELFEALKEKGKEGKVGKEEKAFVDVEREVVRSIKGRTEGEEGKGEKRIVFL